MSQLPRDAFLQASRRRQLGSEPLPSFASARIAGVVVELVGAQRFPSTHSRPLAPLSARDSHEVFTFRMSRCCPPRVPCFVCLPSVELHELQTGVESCRTCPSAAPAEDLCGQSRRHHMGVGNDEMGLRCRMGFRWPQDRSFAIRDLVPSTRLQGSSMT